MTEQSFGGFSSGGNRRFNWVYFLPNRKAWLQTLALFPFGLPVGNFLGASWNLSTSLMLEEHQYLAAGLMMACNLLLPSLFLACVFHWGWFVWHRTAPTWHPQAESLWAGCYATITVAISFGLVRLFTQNFGVCGVDGWGEIGQNLLCNLDGYGFESKSWFGAWFIIAAYCYQAQGAIHSTLNRIFHRHDSHQSNYLTFTTDDESGTNDEEPHS